MARTSTLLICAICVIVVCYICYKDEIETFVTRTNVCNTIDGRCYNVVEKFAESKQASDLLAELNLFSLRMLRHLRQKYLWNNHPNQEARGIVRFLLSNYNPDGIRENAPTSSVNTSYVDDKGKVFGICLREKQSGENKFHSLHDLQFVVLHELSHMGNVTFGHETDFWEVFKFMLREAQLAGLHEPLDYSKKPLDYCSLLVRHNPYFDTGIREI